MPERLRRPALPRIPRLNRRSAKRGDDRTIPSAPQSTLTEDLLQRCAQRAPVYDRENRFFTEDFEELKQAGYLRMPIPEALGGPGLSLSQVCREQRRLAYHAPATALAVNMHLYWV